MLSAIHTAEPIAISNETRTAPIRTASARVACWALSTASCAITFLTYSIYSVTMASAAPTAA